MSKGKQHEAGASEGAFIPVVWLLRRVPRSAGHATHPQRVFMQQRLVNPPCWASEKAVSINLTIPPKARSSE